MEKEDVEKIVQEAIKRKHLVAVEYVRADGQHTTRLMEPFDVSPGIRSKTGEPKFWGWCADHNRVEQRTLSNIISMFITDQEYNPEEHRKAFEPDPAQKKLSWEEA